VVRSPEFNPIESIFAIIKHNFRKENDFKKENLLPLVIKSIKLINAT